MSTPRTKLEVRRAFEQFKSDLDAALSEEPEIPQRHRSRYAAALTSLVTFLDRAGVDQKHCLFFDDLLCGLTDLNYGIVRPYLAPNATGPNRHLDGTDKWRARTGVAVAMHALIKSGRSRSEAATFVSKNFPMLEAIAGKKAKGLKTAVQNWYDEFNQGKVKQRDVPPVYRELIGYIDSQPLTPAMLEQFAVRVLRQSDFFEVARPSG